MIYQTASAFLQLEAGPRGRGYRCTGTELVRYQGVCTPPMVSDSRVLLKVRSDQATVVLITPLWHTQAWFPTLLELLADYPILLPQVQQIIVPSPNCVGPVQETAPQLVAWMVSGKDSELGKFQIELSTSSSAPGGRKPTQITIQHGDHGKVGAPHEVFVPFRQIFQMC